MGKTHEGEIMEQYPKIQTVFNRDPATNYKTVIDGDFSKPEFEYLKKNTWIFTEKVDGTNIRIIWDMERVRFAGKTDNAQIPAFLYDRLTELFDKDLFLEKFSCPVCLYGEGYGAKIQKGGENYKMGGVDFVLFDVLIDGWWLERKNFEEIAGSLGIKIVPIIGEGDLFDLKDLVLSGFNSRWGNFQAEGIVAKPKMELKARNGERIITKLKHKDFIKEYRNAFHAFKEKLR